MTEPIFRYIVFLVAFIVVIRILLGISASKLQENSSKPEDSAIVEQVDQTDALENDQEEIDKSQLPNSQDEETNHE